MLTRIKRLISRWRRIPPVYVHLYKHGETYINNEPITEPPERAILFDKNGKEIADVDIRDHYATHHLINYED